MLDIIIKISMSHMQADDCAPVANTDLCEHDHDNHNKEEPVTSKTARDDLLFAVDKVATKI